MKLRDDFKLRPSQIILAVIALLLVVFFLRVGIWENDYYAGQEGRERATVVSNLEDSVVADETEITEEVKAEYTVPAQHPRYLSIERLGIKNARVLNLGLTKDGAFATPASIFDAGWYNASATPGSGGTLLMDGHNGGPTKDGIFKHLPSLQTGDLITIENGSGTIFKYQVVENLEIPLADATNYMSTAMQSPEPGRESLTLITCSGSWNSTLRTYNSRQFVRATRI